MDAKPGPSATSATRGANIASRPMAGANDASSPMAAVEQICGSDTTNVVRGHREATISPKRSRIAPKSHIMRTKGLERHSRVKTVTRDRALSPKSGLSTDHAPRHSEPGAQTPLGPTHFPDWDLSLQPPPPPLFFIFAAFFDPSFSFSSVHPHRHPPPPASKS